MGTIKPGIVLNNKPLIEAIFEIRWEINTNIPTRVSVDPHYKLLIGSIYEKVKSRYPFHEPLPQSMNPDEISNHVVKHRFRRAKDAWPLIQLGPGIFTLNDTQDYVWSDFNGQICSNIDILFNSHPQSNDIKIKNLLLRYIDSIEFDYKSNVFPFLSENMKVNLSLNEELFTGTGVNDSPEAFDTKFTFPCDNPKGTFQVRFASGTRNQKRAIIWETITKTSDTNIPQTPDEIKEWASVAHDLSHDWFFKIIEGRLEEMFE